MGSAHHANLMSSPQPHWTEIKRKENAALTLDFLQYLRFTEGRFRTIQIKDYLKRTFVRNDFYSFCFE